MTFFYICILTSVFAIMAGIWLHFDAKKYNLD
jgi:hypothetical protein